MAPPAIARGLRDIDREAAEARRARIGVQLDREAAGLRGGELEGPLVEHCHNTTHEDHAMLMRWEINDSGTPFLRPLPTPIPKPQGVVFQSPTVLPDA